MSNIGNSSSAQHFELFPIAFDSKQVDSCLQFPWLVLAVWIHVFLFQQLMERFLACIFYYVDTVN